MVRSSYVTLLYKVFLTLIVTPYPANIHRDVEV